MWIVKVFALAAGQALSEFIVLARNKQCFCDGSMQVFLKYTLPFI